MLSVSKSLLPIKMKSIGDNERSSEKVLDYRERKDFSASILTLYETVTRTIPKRQLIITQELEDKCWRCTPWRFRTLAGLTMLQRYIKFGDRFKPDDKMSSVYYP
jgi:hypothetical protein